MIVIYEYKMKVHSKNQMFALGWNVLLFCGKSLKKDIEIAHSIICWGEEKCEEQLL